MKSPPRGRIMTVMGRRVALRTWESVEREGVVPPRGYEVQSSMREAPDWKASMAEGAVKAAISSIGLLLLWWWCCLGKEGGRGRFGEVRGWWG